jgi:NhaP-type Na+/H+ or K+/H+ antiporter
MFGTGAGAQDFPTLEEGLRAFTDAAQIAQLALGIAVALALAALLAFHPKRRGRVRDEADLSYPNTILLFAVVGAIVAQIVKVSPAMALVVFGIGGLIRFRTRIGAPDDTGHAILATLVGIAAGMGMFLLVFGSSPYW